MAEGIQKEIWTDRTKDWTISYILKLYETPNLFQLDFSSYLNDNFIQKNTKIIEVGCEAAGTAALLNQEADIYLLDYNEHIINIVEQAWQQKKLNAHFVCADMYNMPFEDGYFDVIYNGGVIEHYDKNERNRIFKEYAKKLKTGGYMVIAYPNHHSLPYKVAYTIRTLTNRWPFPKELKIYDLKESIQGLDLEFVSRTVLAKKTVFNWLSFWKWLKWSFKKLDKIFNYEGYLTVVVLRKT